MEYYVIILDAQYDLYQSGDLPADENAQEQVLAQFRAAYERAAAEIANERGVEIDVKHGSYDGPGDYEALVSSTVDEEALEDMWQDIHDRVGDNWRQ